MSVKRNAAQAVKASTGGGDTQISNQIIVVPEQDSNTTGHRRQCIADFLFRGAENAISTQTLVRLTGCSSARQLQSRISAEREHGAVILSISTGGYFLPDDGIKGRREIMEYIATMEARAQNTLRAAESAKASLALMMD